MKNTRNQKRITAFERKIRKRLYYVINNFDRYFNKEKEFTPEYNLNAIRLALPKLIELYTKHRYFSKDEQSSLLSMLDSKNHENWYLAFLRIKSIQKRLK